MKVVILAGGLGTRLAEETSIKPKPMVEIGGMPILWHIMKIYSKYGFNDFIVCLGYKGYTIKEFFYNYYMHQSDITVDLKDNSITIHNNFSEPWKVTLVDTGFNTLTGGRLKRIKQYLNDETFMFTYGDGLSNIDITKLLENHINSKKWCTVTAVQPAGRFGVLNIDERNNVQSFLEKPKGDDSWINGGFFVCEPDIYNFIDDDLTIWERQPMEKIASLNKMNAYKHYDFWKPMDTLRDKQELEELWQTGKAKWKIW